MSVINLTPHPVQVYTEDQFVNLKQVNSTTWVADSVQGDPIAKYPSQGLVRIETFTQFTKTKIGLEGDVVRTTYGAPVGIPESVASDDVLIVSLPTKTMSAAAGHSLSSQMVSPYKVVRNSQNGSIVFGCMGFTY